MSFSLAPQTVHFWQVVLPDFFNQQTSLVKLLNEQEMQRAFRFKFEIHRNRFIIARAMLRKILGLYTQIPPDKIEFAYGKRGKPYLHENSTHLQFNLSHSHDIAVYAITQGTEIGLDIEKQDDNYTEGVAERFFSEQEYNQLIKLPLELQAQAFYQIWVKKEAVIKVLGEGLYASLSDFSVQWDAQDETILIPSDQNPVEMYLHSFNIDSFYPVAIAALQPIMQISRWKWQSDGEYKAC